MLKKHIFNLQFCKFKLELNYKKIHFGKFLTFPPTMLMPRLQFGTLMTSTRRSGPQCLAMRAAPAFWLLCEDELVTVIVCLRSSCDDCSSVSSGGGGALAYSTFWILGAESPPITISVRDLLRWWPLAGALGASCNHAWVTVSIPTMNHEFKSSRCVNPWFLHFVYL